MKKICIVTICNGSNFGNRLQNYALQTVLEERFGASVMTARNMSGEIGKRFLKHWPVLRTMQSAPVQAAARTFLKNGKLLKKFRFLRFNRKYIHMTSRPIDADRIPDGFADRFDCFIAGSDQIWNPGIPFNSSAEYLAFADGKRKIAYAASFGVSELSAPQLETTSRLLADFKRISVREASALSILEQAGRPDAEVVLDPTMLLTAEQWSRMEERPAFVPEEGCYLLSYVLERENAAARTCAEALCAENGWTLIDINDPAQYRRYGIGPEEFLWLIHHAAHICTDSFHASVFSTLFHRDFTVFTRGNMNSRVTTLLSTVSGGREFGWSEGKCTPCLDYDLADQILAEERERSAAFLKHALED